MPFKTFAHGGAGTVRSMVGLAMDRPGDDLGIVIQRPKERMLVQKRHRLLLRGLTLQQLADCAHTEAAVREGEERRLFPGFRWSASS